MNEFPKCICGAGRYKALYNGEWIDLEGKLRFFVVQCLDCSLCRTFPVPRETTSTTEDIKQRLENLKLWRSFAENLIQIIKKLKKRDKLKVLDVGSNIGVFVKLAKENGWQATGIDINKRAVEIGRKKFNVDLRFTSLEEAKFKTNDFDVIILSHTLEHILQLKKLLEEINRILKIGGILIVQVPNIEGLPVKLQKIRGEVWYGYDPRHHVWHFTPKTIRQFLENKGFKILELKTSKPLYYEKTGSFLDIPRDLVLRFSGLLGLADQITLVATPQK